MGKNSGMSQEMYTHIINNMHKLKIDLNNGIITTPKGTNGTLCSSTGYLRVKLSGKLCQVHQILAVCYFGDKCIGMQINHKNGNKIKNTEDNLEIVTQAENIKHEWKTGLADNTRIANKNKRILSDDEVRYIRNNYVFNSYNKNTSSGYLSKKFGISRNVFYLIITNQTYKDII